MHTTDAEAMSTGALPWTHTDRPERRTTVNEHARLRLLLAQQYRRRDLADAANARRARLEGDATDRGIRNRIGRSIIRIGERLAEEPYLEPARPR